MKAALLLAAATSAFAANVPTAVCVIPTNYVDVGTTCTAAKTGYTVNGFCASTWGTAELTGSTAVQTATATIPLATNPTAFDAAAVAGQCTVPSDVGGWTAAGAGQVGLGDENCAALAAAAPFPITAANLINKGATIACATGYYASAGVEGSTLCANVNGAGLYGLAVGTNTNGAWLTGAGATDWGLATWALTTPTLVCSLPCTVPAPYCQSNVYHANIVATGAGLVDGTCNVKPGTSITVVCKSSPTGITYTGACAASATTTDNSAAATLTWDANGAPVACAPGLDAFASGIYALEQPVGTQLAEAVYSFPLATSTSAQGVAQTLSSQWGGKVRQTVAKPFLDGAAYNIVVENCDADATTRTACVQETINYWRCHGMTVDTASVCTANGVQIPCPTHTNGFRCPSDSKKGLLGLLGLLGLIPLLCLLLLCCFLLPCLLRRRKTEGDVHFATFDPHAAPIAGSIAPGTACYAPSIGAVPTAVY